MSKSNPYLHHCGAPSSFISSMEKAFGSFPVRLTQHSIPVLQGMAAMYGDDRDNPYREIVEILEEEDGGIELYAEW